MHDLFVKNKSNRIASLVVALVHLLLTLNKCSRKDTGSSHSLPGGSIAKCYFINPFHITGLFLYPLKTSENHSFFLMLLGGIERDQ